MYAVMVFAVLRVNRESVVRRMVLIYPENGRLADSWSALSTKSLLSSMCLLLVRFMDRSLFYICKLGCLGRERLRQQPHVTQVWRRPSITSECFGVLFYRSFFSASRWLYFSISHSAARKLIDINLRQRRLVTGSSVIILHPAVADQLSPSSYTGGCIDVVDGFKRESLASE